MRALALFFVGAVKSQRENYPTKYNKFVPSQNFTMVLSAILYGMVAMAMAMGTRRGRKRVMHTVDCCLLFY